MEAPRLTLGLLGPLDARIAGEAITTFEYAKVRALLALLVTEAPRALSREQLCALLWPDRPERPARQNLSQALAQLRRALRDQSGDDALIQATSETIGLNPSALESTAGRIEVDVWRFRALIESSERHVHRDWQLCTPCATRLREAIALYRGDFLSQLLVDDSLPFEDWASAHRGPLRQQMLTALERLMRYAEWRDDGAEAIACARRLVAAEPWIEANHRDLVRLLAVNGQRSAALSHLAALRRGLRAELETEPEEATEALARAVEVGDRAVVVSHAQTAPFHLPTAPTALIGREGDVTSLLARIRNDGARLLTLCGPAGVGKTRLAIELANQLRHDYVDGAAFVDLSPLTEPTEVPVAIAQALRLPEAPHLSPVEVVRGQLRERHLLLVLDNFEHVIDAAAHVADWLAACPPLCVLVTSRTPLRVRAEHVVDVEPLAVPEPTAAPDRINASPAVRLLVERIRAAWPAYALDPGSAAEAAEICRRLDGLPLAIELIAGQASQAGVGELLRQLEHEGLQALETGPRDLPDRQRTLRRALAWTYARLSPEAQQLFAQLGVFSDGFSVEAANAVVEPAGSAAALPHLRAVRLIAPDPRASNHERQRLLETVRAFALEQLTARHGSDPTRRRHAAYFLELAETARPQLEGPDQVAWFDRLSAELANFESALAWCLNHDRVLGMRLSVALALFWRSRGHIGPGRRWLAAQLAADAELPQELRGQALVAACRLAWAQGDVGPARQLAEETLAATQGDALARAEALTLAGDVKARIGETEAARDDLEQALAIYRTRAHRAGEAEALHFLSRLATMQGDYARGMALGLESRSIYQALQNPRRVAGQGLNLGVYAFEQGDYPNALSLTTESLAIFRHIGDVTGIAIALLNLGNILRETGDLSGARLALEEAVALERQRHGRALASALGALGEVHLKAGDPAARACLAESLTLRLQSGDVSGLALSLSLLAEWHANSGRAAQAARLVGAAETLRATGQVTLHPNRRAAHDRFLGEIRATLGAPAFEAARAQGRTLTRDQAAQLALEA